LDNVDYTQRTAGEIETGDDVSRILKELRSVHPYWHVWADPVKAKRFEDGMRGALAGMDTTEEDDARMRQENPNPKSQDEQDDEFWASDEPKNQMPRRL
jgi:hypothetical protein